LKKPGANQSIISSFLGGFFDFLVFPGFAVSGTSLFFEQEKLAFWL